MHQHSGAFQQKKKRELTRPHYSDRHEKRGLETRMLKTYVKNSHQKKALSEFY